MNIIPMNKKASLHLVFFFICAQLISLSHMAEHGFEEHDHQGQICSIYLHSQYTDDTLVDTFPVSTNFGTAHSSTIDYHYDTELAQQHLNIQPRAPPYCA